MQEKMYGMPLTQNQKYEDNKIRFGFALNLQGILDI